MSAETRCRDLLFARLWTGWTRSPLLGEGQRTAFDPEDPGSCAAFTPPSAPAPFRAEQVNGTAGESGVGFAVASFDEIDRDGAFLGRTGWMIVRLHLVVDLYAPETGDLSPIEDGAGDVRRLFTGFEMRDGETDAILKLDPSDETSFHVLAAEGGRYRAQIRVPIELKIYTHHEENPSHG